MAGGKRGPKRKSAAASRRQGNPGKRRRSPAKPGPPAGTPDCPDWLPKDARAEWERVVPALSKIGLLSEVDQAALASYCLAVANLRSATEALAASGSTTFTTDKGYVGKHPAVTVQREAMQTVLKFAQEFGLTPAARDRLDIKPATAGSEVGSVMAYAQAKGS